MPQKRVDRLGDQIRRAVDESGLSRCRICAETGIDKGSFSRFMAGKAGLQFSNLEALADLLGLVVKVDPKRRKPR